PCPPLSPPPRSLLCSSLLERDRTRDNGDVTVFWRQLGSGARARSGEMTGKRGPEKGPGEGSRRGPGEGPGREPGKGPRRGPGRTAQAQALALLFLRDPGR